MQPNSEPRLQSPANAPVTNDLTNPGGGRSAPWRFSVRQARVTDSEEAAAVLRASISVLCVADHGSAPVVVAPWLANKTAANVRSWIEGPGCVVVAEARGRIVGVGAAAACGETTLNYVLPEARFRGVSKAVLSELEAYLRTQGHTRVKLTSTRTARRFYRAMGYVDAGDPRRPGGITEFPMFKEFSI